MTILSDKRTLAFFTLPSGYITKPRYKKEWYFIKIINRLPAISKIVGNRLVSDYGYIRIVGSKGKANPMRKYIVIHFLVIYFVMLFFIIFMLKKRKN